MPSQDVALAAATETARRPGARLYLLAAEFLVVFCALPLAAAVPSWRLPHLPLLLAVAAACAVLLARDPTFDRRRLWSWKAAEDASGAVGRRAFAALVAVVALVAALYPDRLLDLPLEQPLAWAALSLAYPVLSAYPQEIVYRAFLLHRYRPIFGEGRLAVAASAIAFSFLHVVYLNWPALVLTLPAGALLALTYRRTGSLAASTLEHTLYGLVAFTFGLGKFFLSGPR
jgi:membrane protease YdiL (CAAX protease family)